MLSRTSYVVWILDKTLNVVFNTACQRTMILEETKNNKSSQNFMVINFFQPPLR